MPTRKPSRNVHFVVQHEGWLLKRGAGYVPESQRSAEVKEAQAAKKRGPGKMKRSNTLVRGKKERKRYFTLVSIKSVDAETPVKPYSELRYYTEVPSSTDTKTKGVVILSPNMKVELGDDNSFTLVTDKRTYYLRLTLDDTSSAEARVLASQWYNAVESALAELRFSKVSRATSPNMVNVETNHGQDDNDPDMKSLDQKLVDARITDYLQKENWASEHVYGSIWVHGGIEAYNNIITHFGPVRTDVERLLQHYNANKEQLLRQIESMDKVSYISQEATLREQQTMKVVLEQMHIMSKKRKEALKKCAQSISKDCLKPLAKLKEDMNSRLETIVRYNMSTTQTRATLQKIYRAATKHVRWVESQMENQLMDEAQPTEKGLRKPSIPIGRKYSNHQPRKSISSPHDLQSARMAQHEIEERIMLHEKGQASKMISAMDALETLERQRLTTQKQLMIKTAEIEKAMLDQMTEIFADDSKVFEKLDNVDPTEDIRKTSEKLLSTTKSSLPVLATKQERAQKAKP